MEAVIVFGLVVLFNLIVLRTGTLALRHTGLSREASSFQAQSAFMGVGFTTKESEALVNHPVRRRIVRILMWGGYSGIVVSVATIVSGVGSSDGGLMRFMGLLLITSGLLLSLWQLPPVRKVADRVISRAISSLPDLRVIDFEKLLELEMGYTVAHLHVDRNRWMTGKNLRELRLADEGVLVLNVRRASGAVIGTPKADTALEAGDLVLTYGRHECLERLRNRPLDPGGDLERVRSVEEHKELQVSELAAEEELAKTPPMPPEADSAPD
ncbi:MAG: potassium transporter TrkA [Planctomycetota bacterium]|nr:potassium transporter TrkA [Planctomycetota bacterium]